MKYLIYPERQGTPTATSSDAVYIPAWLTSNNIRKKGWKALSGVATATLRCPISANASVLTLQGTNAESAMCTLTLDSAEKALDAQAAVDVGGGLVTIPLTGHGYTVGQTLLFYGTTNYDGVHVLPVQTAGGEDDIVITATFVAETFSITDTACVIVETTTHDLLTIPVDRLWQRYTSQVAAHTATIKLAAASGVTVYAGIFRAGTLVTIKGPHPGVGEADKDYDIIYEMRNGAFDGKAGEVVRTFDYQIIIPRETTLRTLQRIHRYYRPDPFAMLISNQAGNDNMWSVFGRLLQVRATHDMPIDSSVSISVEEVV